MRSGAHQANGVGRTCCGGFFGGGLGYGLSGGVGLIVGAVSIDYLLAVCDGGEFCGVAIAVRLDGDCGSLTHGVVDGEDDGLTEGVSRGGCAGLHCHGLAASATHCKQGKRRYEDSR